MVGVERKVGIEIDVSSLRADKSARKVLARKKKSTTHKIQSLNAKLQQHTSTDQVVSGRPELHCMFFFSKHSCCLRNTS